MILRNYSFVRSLTEDEICYRNCEADFKLFVFVLSNTLYIPESHKMV